MSDHFADRLIQAVKHKRTPLVVGLDPRLEQLPKQIRQTIAEGSRVDPAHAADAFTTFCCGVIDAVAPLVPAVKPQAAFFEALGPAGMASLMKLVQYARSKGLMVIMDAKRGDIGSTAEAYARAWLGDENDSAWSCDALTVNPWLGDDSLTPFVDRCREVGTGIFVLVRTSNPGGRMLQELQTESGPLYTVVADHIERLAAADLGESGYGSVGAVIGATHPQQLAELRARMLHTIFLVPGLGAQGATASDIAGAFDERGLGAVINSSRAIIFAFDRPEYARFEHQWQRAVEAATTDTIAQIAAESSACRRLR